MVAKYRELTEKYKSFRLQPDALFLSRMIQTFFSKFTKKGKKALARRHILRALICFRMTFCHPIMYYALLRIFHRLRIQLMLITRRKGRKLVNVPVPVRRNKRDVLNIQTLYATIQDRRERILSERISLELEALAFRPRFSSTMRKRSSNFSDVYDERVNMDYR